MSKMTTSRASRAANGDPARSATEVQPSAASDPFAMARCGGSPRTGTSASGTSTGATTAAVNPDALQISSSVLETRSSSDQLTETLPLFGGAPSTGATAKRASSVRSSATKVRTSRPSLSDRLTASLINAGLVCGITPSSTRKLSGGKVAVLAFAMPAGRPSGALSNAQREGS